MSKLVLLLCVLTLGWGQRTYKRACDCEYMINGKCAYTLLLPVGKESDQTGSTCPTPGGDGQQPAGDVLDRINTTLSSLQQVTTQQGDQLARLSEQSSSTTESVNYILSLVNNGIDRQALEEFNNRTIKTLQSILTQQQSQIDQITATVSGIQSSIQDLTDLQSLLDLAEQLNTKVNTLKVEINLLKQNGGLCAKKGRLVEGLSDAAITASSEYDSAHGTSRSRLFTKGTNTTAGAWCPAEPNSAYEYIQYDLGSVRTVHAVITQGRQDYEQWVTSYNMDYTTDSVITNTTVWQVFHAEWGMWKYFEGNTDNKTPQVNWLWQPITARYVRIVPLDSNIINNAKTNKCLRADLIGCLD